MSKKYFLTLLSVLVLSAGCLLVSCSKDDNESSEPENVEVTPANPMVGKTIKCVENNNSDWVRISTNFSIQFVSATKFIWKLKQKAEDYDLATNRWNTTLDLDKTIEGTYQYSSSRIFLRQDDGGTKTLTKEGNGWKEGNYLYK